MGRVILYNVSHYGLLSRIIMYNMAKHPNDKCILLMDTGWLSEESHEFIDKVERVPSFDVFITYSESDISDSLEDRTYERCVGFFEKKLADAGINIDDVDVVYTGFDTIHAFGLFLEANKKHHNLFDGNMVTSTDSAGFLDKSEYHRLLRDKKAITWNSPYVDTVIYTLGHSFDEIKEIMVTNNHPSKNREPAFGKTI